MVTPPPIKAPGRFTLRDYQEHAIKSVVDGFARGVTRQLIVIPTGSGKTAIVARLPEHIGDPRMLFTVHREELLQQAMLALQRERPDRRVGLERAASQPGPQHVTVVASIQSLAQPVRLARYRPEDWPFMVIDEAHRSPAPTYQRVLRHLRHLANEDETARVDGLLLGVTATSQRTDQVGLGNVYQEVVYTRSLRDMVEAGWLVPLRGYLLRGGANLEHVATAVREGEQDYDPRALARAVNTPARNQLVVEGSRHLAAVRPTLVFAVDVDHTDALAAAFCEAGIRAAAVHGDLPMDVRRKRLEQFVAGRLDVLVNCQLLLEGVDIPQISAIVMARPTRSSLLYAQAVGRATRLCPGKTDALVIDFVDNTQEHASSLVTLPRLFGLPAVFNLMGAAAHETAQKFEDVATALDAGLDDATVQRIRSPQDLQRLFYEVDILKIAGLPPKVNQLTNLAWQRMPDGAFALTLPRARSAWEGTTPLADDGTGERGARMEVVENLVGHWEVRRRPWYGAAEKLAEFESLERAIREADGYVLSGYPDRMVLIRKRAKWRREPATDKQRQFLGSLGQPVPPALTKGQAQLMIDRALALRHTIRARGS
jgi:superfamily II DNA or RNA helicase